jgi:hypothetical protein
MLAVRMRKSDRETWRDRDVQIFPTRLTDLASAHCYGDFATSEFPLLRTFTMLYIM